MSDSLANCGRTNERPCARPNQLKKGWQRYAGSDLKTSRETWTSDDAERLTRQRLRVAEAVRDGKLVIPISQKLPLSEAADAQAAAERGAARKILLVVRFSFANEETKE
jgi:NADPH:quinone reductase-like Zn-dependent oxidoreductase